MSNFRRKSSSFWLSSFVVVLIFALFMGIALVGYSNRISVPSNPNTSVDTGTGAESGSGTGTGEGNTETGGTGTGGTDTGESGGTGTETGGTSEGDGEETEPKQVIKVENLVFTKDSESNTVNVAAENQDIVGEITIPSYVKQKDEEWYYAKSGEAGAYSVASIGEYGFVGCEKITSVIIPNSVLVIDRYAFYSCKGLKSVSMTDSVTEVRKSAFLCCDKLEKINFSKNLINLEDSAFSYCFAIKNVDLSVCTKLTSIIRGTFWGCSMLEVLSLPASVNSMGKDIFVECDNLKTINYGGTREQWDKMSVDARLPAGVTINCG